MPRRAAPLLILAVLVSAGVARGQQVPSTPPMSEAELLGGPATRRLSVPVKDAPRPGDVFVLIASTTPLEVVLIRPDGGRVTKASAGALGFTWVDRPDPNFALVAHITFTAAGAAGDYQLEVSVGAGAEPSLFRATFLSPSRLGQTRIDQLPGFVKAGPVDVGPGGGALPLSVARDIERGLLDIVVSDPEAHATLRFPDGAVLGPDGAEARGVEWTQTEDHPQPVEFFGIPLPGPSTILLPEPGLHHVLYFSWLARGRYEIRVDRAARVTAAANPFLRDPKAVDGLTPLGPGELRVKVHDLPHGCQRGDRIGFQVTLLGESPAPGVTFAVALKYTALPEFDVPPGAPRTLEGKRVAVKVSPAPGGRWRGTVVAAKAGNLLVTVRAQGKLSSGRPFSDVGRAVVFVTERPPSRP